MVLKVIGINMRNWVDSAQDRDYWRALVKCGIEPPSSISHGVSRYRLKLVYIERSSLAFTQVVAVPFTLHDRVTAHFQLLTITFTSCGR